MPTSSFTSYRDADVADLIAEYPLAWVSGRHGGPASLLPLVAERDGAGRVRALIGHMARHNPLMPALAADPAAAFLFTGPHAYMPPALVSQPGWAPTWNYAQVRIEAALRFDEAATDAALAVLIAQMERGPDAPWSPSDMGPRYDRLTQGIIAFRATVERIEGRFKLGQDETATTLREILAAHPDAALVRWMRRMNGGWADAPGDREPG